MKNPRPKAGVRLIPNASIPSVGGKPIFLVTQGLWLYDTEWSRRWVAPLEIEE